MITAREAWITGTIVGLMNKRHHGRIPGSDMTVHPSTDPQGNWMGQLEVRDPDNRVVARILIIDAEFSDAV